MIPIFEAHSNPLAHSPEAECNSLAPRLPPQWNASTTSHSFVYAHIQSSMQFVVHIDRMGSKTEIRGLATGDDRIARFDITARDYISSASLPLRITMTADGEEDRSNLQQKLKTVFISEERIKGTFPRVPHSPSPPAMVPYLTPLSRPRPPFQNLSHPTPPPFALQRRLHRRPPPHHRPRRLPLPRHPHRPTPTATRPTPTPAPSRSLFTPPGPPTSLPQPLPSPGPPRRTTAPPPPPRR